MDCLIRYDGFNHKEFYKWAIEQENIYISEYEMPTDDFIQIARIGKRQLSTTNGASALVEEKIFTNRKTFENLTSRHKTIIQFSMAKQTTLADF